MREAFDEVRVALIALTIVAVPYLCYRLSGAQSTYELQHSVASPMVIMSGPIEYRGPTAASAGQ